MRSAARIPSEACFQQRPPSELLVLDASPDFVQRSTVEDADPSGKASSESGGTLDPVAEQMFVEKALPRTLISEAPATCKEITTTLCCAIERANVLLSSNPLRSDLISSSKDRVLKHHLFEKHHVMGYTVEAEHLGVSKRLLHCMMQACACAHFLLFWHDALRANS